eukprot:1924015-Pleurochrysis_carterae.AAC.1
MSVDTYHGHPDCTTATLTWGQDRSASEQRPQNKRRAPPCPCPPTSPSTPRRARSRGRRCSPDEIRATGQISSRYKVSSGQGPG